MYAAQWFACMRRAAPDLDMRIAAGDLTPVFAWLHANVWSQASRWETPELVQRASGEALNPAFFRAHLESRYQGKPHHPVSFAATPPRRGGESESLSPSLLDEEGKANLSPRLS
jgi:hypothetical protein